MNFDFVYKICTKSEWNEAKQNNIFKGTALDLKDGYIHFSDKDQINQTLNKFYEKQSRYNKRLFNNARSHNFSGIFAVLEYGFIDFMPLLNLCGNDYRC